jgi:methylmalonyl-CoA/ethylmalonyl-CoA epimerase
MMAIDALSHVGIVVPDLKTASTLFAQRFGCTVSAPIDVPKQGLRMAYVNLGAAAIELMAPTRPDSPIAKFLERNPNGGLHHIAFSVDNARSAAAEAAREGLRILGAGEPRPGHHGRPIFFLHPRDILGTLVEIEERVPTKNSDAARNHSGVDLK